MIRVNRMTSYPVVRITLVTLESESALSYCIVVEE